MLTIPWGGIYLFKRILGKSNKNKGRACLKNSRIYFEKDAESVTLDITDSDFFSVLKNNEVVKDRVEVSPSDTIQIIYNNHIISSPQIVYETSVVGENELVILSKKIKNGSYYQLENINEYTDVLHLKLELTAMFPEPTKIEDLETLLDRKGYDGVFLNENIAKVSLSEVDIELPVVEAKKPIPGEPARFELITGISNSSVIDKDQFFAKYVDETEGIDGYDVYGTKIKAENLFYFPELDNNVMVEDRGLISLTRGRLIFDKTNIGIIEVNTVEKTINWEDGLIIYETDVVIEGDIKEGGQIKCNGNITITGGVYESYVFADGDVTIKGKVDQSVIYSGFSKTAAVRVESYSLQYLVIIERVMFESSFTAADGFDYSEKRKSLELAESEFKAIKNSISPFFTLVFQYGNDEVIKLYNQFNQIVDAGLDIVLDDQSNTESIKEVMDSFYAIIESSKKSLKDDLGSLVASGSDNSHLTSFLGIRMEGPGTYQSNIESGSTIEIAGKSLSTNLIAKSKIEVEEFNPGNRTDCFLSVTKGSGVIRAREIHSYSNIRIRNTTHTTEEDLINVEITENYLEEKKRHR